MIALARLVRTVISSSARSGEDGVAGEDVEESVRELERAVVPAARVVQAPERVEQQVELLEVARRRSSNATPS